MSVGSAVPEARRAAGRVARGRAVAPPRYDLLRVPVVGSFLRWRRSRLVLQLLAMLVALSMILHGLLGPSLAPKNLATVLTWVHYRGALVLGLFAAGNLFCMGCPFLLPRELARRVFRPAWSFPRALRNKWLAVLLLVGVLFCYELFDLWSAPFWTAVLILGYFVAALVVDAIFRGAPFCKHVCPIGQFNFAASTLSPLEVSVREPGVCEGCRTKDCIRGRRDPREPERVVQRGCELGLYQPLKVGNVDCTFCLDCVYACPHDNVGIHARLPGEELASDPRRSGVGRLLQRKDCAALVIAFTFGGLLNAFGMVSPVYALESWLASAFGTHHEAPVLAAVFAFALVVEPVVLLGLASWSSRAWSGMREPLVKHATRRAFALLPLGFGIWIAHYCFHFLTGLWTFVPVAQHALEELGAPILGEPEWGLGGLRAGSVWPIEIGFLGLGLLCSLVLAFRLARDDAPSRPWRSFLPWGALCLLVFASAIWLLAQPMEMRGTFL